MPYLSHPVRRIRDDPTEGRSVSLLLAFAEDEPAPPLDAVRRAVRDAGGTVDRRLEFSTIEVTVPEHAVAAVCEIDGLSSVETSGRLGLAVETVADVADSVADVADSGDGVVGSGDEPDSTARSGESDG